MILAITSTGNELSSLLDSRFGRASTIAIYDTESSEFRTIKNEVSMNAPQGAGIQTAQLMIEIGADVLITGNLGPKAFKVLEAGQIATYKVGQVTVENAITQYKNNELEQLIAPNVEGHWT